MRPEDPSSGGAQTTIKKGSLSAVEMARRGKGVCSVDLRLH